MDEIVSTVPIPRYSFGCLKPLYQCDKCGLYCIREKLVMTDFGLLRCNDKTGCGLIREMKDITPVTLNIELDKD